MKSCNQYKNIDKFINDIIKNENCPDMILHSGFLNCGKHNYRCLFMKYCGGSGFNEHRNKKSVLKHAQELKKKRMIETFREIEKL